MIIKDLKKRIYVSTIRKPNYHNKKWNDLTKILKFNKTTYLLL